jgi:hypothetical protein
MITKKIKYLLFLHVVLILAIGITIAWRTNDIDFQKNQLPNFALTDSAEVDKLVLGKMVLQRQFGTTWTMNNKTIADPFMVEQLLMMLQKTAIKRTLTDHTKNEITQKIANEGIEIQYFAGNVLKKSFKIIGFENETFAQLPSTTPYVIYTPAYKGLLHEILTLPEKEWRNRTLISTGWNSLQTLEVKYLKNPEQSFSIVFDSLLYKTENQIFYKLSGVQKLDSVMLFNYVQAFNSVRIAKYLANAPLKDSLQKLPPYCILSVTDLNAKQNNTIKLYPTNNKMFGIVEKTDELVLFDMRYISGLLLRRKDFEK